MQRSYYKRFLMSHRNLWFLLALSLFAHTMQAQPRIDLRLARRYFEEAKALSAADAGRLWGHTLSGPMLFVEPRTRAVVANQPDAEGRLRAEDSVYVGTLPKEIGVANTAVAWSGVRWTMLLWPLPDDRFERAALLMHESFHRIQPELGLAAANPICAHLDALQGRYWLRLEWQALLEALRHSGNARIRDVRNALIFRRKRHLLFPGADSLETALELNEGLAEYTGIRLSGSRSGEILTHLTRKIEVAGNQPSLVRSFAYISGPLYGLLLDEFRPEWRKAARAGVSLAALLADAVGLSLRKLSLEEAESRAREYGGREIYPEEAAREARRQQRLTELRARFVDGTVLILPLRKMNIQFDPRNLQPLDSLGTVYPTARISDEWGVLEVKGGVLISPDWREARVAANSIDRNGSTLSGQGWTLTLQRGWDLSPAANAGIYRLQKK